MQVRMQFFAALRDAAKASEIALELEDGATVDGALQALMVLYPSVERFVPQLRLAVNDSFVDSDHPLEEGDTVALIPPVSGG